MKRILIRALIWLMVVSIGFTVATASAVAAEVPRISKEELKPLLDQGKVTVIDVRRGGDWDSSDQKIQGAVREDPDGISWAPKYSKDQLLVLYCA